MVSRRSLGRDIDKTRGFFIIETALLKRSLAEYRKQYYNKNNDLPSVALEEEFIDAIKSKVREEAIEIIRELRE
ncbi:MAG: hypothetical protein LBR82_03685 [Desulfovibrio sp.]|jgi:hypothetical protein|nr:hypothetical protein [Desulfovibrio sp.]